jgi:hypothetical protein
MRIYRRAVYQMTAAGYELLEADCYEYDGPLALCGGGSPSAPDPYATAQAQTSENQQTAAYNQQLALINTQTPLGSQTYTQQGVGSTGAPIYNQQISLSPQEQAIFGQTAANQLGQAQIAGAEQGPLMQSLANQPITMGMANPLTSNVQAGPLASGVNTVGPKFGIQQPEGPTAAQLFGQVAPNMQTGSQVQQAGGVNAQGIPGIAGAGNLAGFTEQAQNAAYQNQAQYLDPQFAQGQQALQAQLAAQGAVPGSQAYNNAMQNFNLQKQQAYSNATNQAVAQGLAEQQALYGESANTNQQLFGQAATSAGIQNQAAAQNTQAGLAEAQLRNTALQNLFGMGLQGNQQGFQQNAAQQQAYNQAAQQATQNNLLQSQFQNQAQGQAFGEGQQNAALGNQANAQQFQNLFALQNEPINQYNALMTGAQAQVPNFQGPQQNQINPPNISGYMQNYYQGQLNAANAQNATVNAGIGAGGNALSSYLLYNALGGG